MRRNWYFFHYLLRDPYRITMISGLTNVSPLNSESLSFSAEPSTLNHDKKTSEAVLVNAQQRGLYSFSQILRYLCCTGNIMVYPILYRNHQGVPDFVRRYQTLTGTSSSCIFFRLTFFHSRAGKVKHPPCTSIALQCREAQVARVPAWSFLVNNGFHGLEMTHHG